MDEKLKRFEDALAAYALASKVLKQAADDLGKGYYDTDHWKETRAKKRREAGNRCDTCGAKKDLNVHHLTYATVGREHMADLKVLCRECHRKVHGRDENGNKVPELVKQAVKMAKKERRKSRKNKQKRSKRSPATIPSTIPPELLCQRKEWFTKSLT